MSYRSTLTCLTVVLLALAVVAGVVRNQPAQQFCLTDQGDCATPSNWQFNALSVER
jgi:hypothetical protein